MLKKLVLAFLFLLLPVVASASILGVQQGGTASSTLSGILIGNGISQVSTLTIGSNLTLTGTTLSASGGGSTFPFTPTTFGATNANATSTLIGFTQGIYALASSTIGNGTQTSGLTISGGATTTGNAYVMGTLGVNVLAPTAKLEVQGTTADNTATAFIAWDSNTKNIFQVRNDGLTSVGSSTPFAKLAVHANNLETNTVLFAIGSSTASATSTLFSVDNNGGMFVGIAGTTTNAFQVINNARTAGNGLSVTSSAAGSGVNIGVQSANPSEGLTILAKGLGTASFGSNNGATTNITAGGATRITSNGTSMSFSISALVNGNTSQFTFTGAANSGLTTNLEATDLAFNFAQRKIHGNGTVALQRSVFINAPIEAFTSFAASNSFTDLATLGLSGAPSISVNGNGTATNVHTLLLSATTTLNASTTNSYGLTVNANSGAVNNYAAQFLGGNVGVGTTSPFAKLSVHANNLESNLNLFVVASSTASATTTLFSVKNQGEITVGGGTPTISTCGSVPNGSVVGNDTTGTVTIGGGAVVACTVSYSTAKQGTPHVFIQVDGATGVANSVSASTATGFTANFASVLGGGSFDYFVVSQ